MLPTIKTPEYDLTLPISKEVVTYRPFLVREEKNVYDAQGRNRSKSYSE